MNKTGRYKIKEIKRSIPKTLQWPKPDESHTTPKKEIPMTLSHCIYSRENVIHYHCLLERKSSSSDLSVTSKAVQKGFKRTS